MRASDVIQNSGPDLRQRAEAAYAATEEAFRKAAARDWRRMAVPNNLSQQDWLLDLMRHELGADEHYGRHQAERRQAAEAEIEDDGPKLSVKHRALLRALAAYARSPKRRPARDRDRELIQHFRDAQRRKTSALDKLVGKRCWAVDGQNTCRTGLI